MLFLGQHFEIGHRGQQLRIPVDQPLAAVDEAFVVQANEYFGDRSREVGVHRELVARPVHRGAEAAHLARDGAAGLRLPFPHALDERLAPEVAAGVCPRPPS